MSLNIILVPRIIGEAKAFSSRQITIYVHRVYIVNSKGSKRRKECFWSFFRRHFDSFEFTVLTKATSILVHFTPCMCYFVYITE